MLVAGVAVSATQDATIKLISTDYPFHEMQFIRSAAALPLIFLLTLRRHELGAAVHAADRACSICAASCSPWRAPCSMSAWRR